MFVLDYFRSIKSPTYCLSLLSYTKRTIAIRLRFFNLIRYLCGSLKKTITIMDFAKLFTVGKSQLVLMSDSDDTDEECPFYMELICKYKGIKATIKLRYKTERELNKQFRKFAQENADNFYKGIVSSIEGNS